MPNITSENPFGSMTTIKHPTSEFSITQPTFVLEETSENTTSNNTEKTVIGSLVSEFKDKPLQMMTKELLKDILFLTPIGWIILAFVGVGMLIYKFRGEIKTYCSDLQELVNYIVK